jgi:hypothetical protein
MTWAAKLALVDLDRLATFSKPSSGRADPSEDPDLARNEDKMHCCGLMLI